MRALAGLGFADLAGIRARVLLDRLSGFKLLKHTLQAGPGVLLAILTEINATRGPRLIVVRSRLTPTRKRSVARDLSPPINHLMVMLHSIEGADVILGDQAPPSIAVIVAPQVVVWGKWPAVLRNERGRTRNGLVWRNAWR